MSEYFCNARVMTPPPTTGWIELTLNDEAFDRVETYIKKSQEKPHSLKRCGIVFPGPLRENTLYQSPE